MPTIKHTHQYIRVSFKKRDWYMCAHPDCTSMKKKEYLRGKSSICSTCFNKFTLDAYALTVARPQCLKCRDTKDVRDAQSALKDIEIF